MLKGSGVDRGTDREPSNRQALIARITDTVIFASSNLKARAFEGQSNKKRFYPDAVYC